MTEDTELGKAYAQVLRLTRNEVRDDDAAIVRGAKVAEPIDDTEQYLNAVLEDVARAIERRRHSG